MWWQTTIFSNASFFGFPRGAQMPHNKQLQRTVIRRHMRAASASFHYALAARWIAQRAAAELRRYAARLSASHAS